MPGRNRTGPFGQGPMTGRGAGYCGGTGAGNNAGYGQSFGRGGRGRGWRHRFFATGVSGWARFIGFTGQQGPNPHDEREVLVNQAKELQQGIDQINARLHELDTVDNKASN